MTELLVDASVILKWYLPDEEFGEKALRILNRHVNEEIEILAPTILPYEVLNALMVAERMGRTDNELTRKSFRAFLKLDIRFLNPFRDYPNVLSLARAFKTSVYDAAYLSLAMKKKTDFVTGDKRLYNSVNKELKWVKWIGKEEENHASA